MGYEGIEELAAQGSFIDVTVYRFCITGPDRADDLGDGIVWCFI